MPVALALDGGHELGIGQELVVSPRRGLARFGPILSSTRPDLVGVLRSGLTDTTIRFGITLERLQQTANKWKESVVTLEDAGGSDTDFGGRSATRRVRSARCRSDSPAIGCRCGRS